MDTSSLTMLGKYEIRGMLGRGAMGVVYDGWDPQIARRVAIKTVRLPDASDAETTEELARFKREAQAAGRLSHPNIVGVYDYGQTSEMAGGDVAYIVMEFVEGQSLKALLDAEERFPVTETARVFDELLTGLQFSHERGVIHRDIKPANVMVARDGRVKIADFGIARIESSSMTQAGTVMGTPAYMSPEQFMGQAVDARTDVYSSGVLLYQMLTGERPFEGSMTAIMHKVLNTVPPRPSELSVVAPPGLDPVVSKAMQRRPEDRFASAAEFARALRAALDVPARAGAAGSPTHHEDTTIVATPTRRMAASADPTPPAAPVRKPKIALLGGISALALAVVAGGAWFALGPSATKPAPHAAATEPAVASGAPAAPAAPPSRPSEQQAAIQQVPPPAPPPTVAPEPPSTPVPAPAPQPVAPPPAAATTVAPPVETVPAETSKTGPLPNPSVIRQALAEIGRSAHCALARFNVSGDGHVTVSGVVGAGAPEASLRDAVQNAAPRSPTSWLVRSFDGPYCQALEVLQPIGQTSGPFLNLSLKDEATILKDRDAIVPVLKLPEFPAHLIVDYLSHDGSVTHLFPTAADQDRVFAANSSFTPGGPVHGVGEVGPPFGTDMIIAVASSFPLFAQRRPAEGDTAQSYLPALQSAIDSARARNARIAGRALVLETAEH